MVLDVLLELVVLVVDSVSPLDSEEEAAVELDSEEVAVVELDSVEDSNSDVELCSVLDSVSSLDSEEDWEDSVSGELCVKSVVVVVIRGIQGSVLKKIG